MPATQSPHCRQDAPSASLRNVLDSSTHLAWLLQHGLELCSLGLGRPPAGQRATEAWSLTQALPFLDHILQKVLPLLPGPPDFSPPERVLVVGPRADAGCPLPLGHSLDVILEQPPWAWGTAWAQVGLILAGES